jgi:hypothetical protein
MGLDASFIPQKLKFIDKAGFNLAQTRRRGRNIIPSLRYLATLGEMSPYVQL